MSAPTGALRAAPALTEDGGSGRAFTYGADELTNWGRFTFQADAACLRRELRALWRPPDASRGGAAAPVLLVLVGVTTDPARPGVSGYRAPVPISHDRAMRLGGFAKPALIATAFARLQAHGAVHHERRAPRVVAGRVLPGQAQRVAIADRLLAKRGGEDPRDEAWARQHGIGGRASFPASWFYGGHIASLPAPARYLLLLARAWEAVQDIDAYMRPMIERGTSPVQARQQANRYCLDGAADDAGWAERAGMDRRTYRAALDALTAPVLGPSCDHPYLSMVGDGGARYALITTRLDRHPAPLPVEVLNGPQAAITEARRALFGAGV